MVHETENRKQIEEQSKGAWILGEKLKQQKLVGGKNILIKSINKSFKWS